MKLILSIILLFCVCHFIVGQELHGRFLDHNQGLLSKECYDINSDKTGYLIVGTQYGPMKYDGEKFVPICMNLSIKRRIMYDFEKDANGDVYLLNSKNELFLLKDDRAIFIGPKNLNSITNDTHFRKLHCYAGGIIINAGTVYHFSHKTKMVRKFNIATNKKYHVFTFDRSKNYPFRLYNSSNRAQKCQINFLSEKKTFSIPLPYYSEARDDIIHIGKTDFVLINMELFRIRGNSVIHFPYRNILFIEYIHDRIWLPTYEGLIELDKEGNFIQKHFNGQIIGGVAPLSNGGMAVSLNQKGIFISSNINERIYRDIIPTEVTHWGNQILIGTKKGEIFQFGNCKLKKVCNTIPYDWHYGENFLKNIRKIEFIDNKWYICVLAGVYSINTNFKAPQRLEFGRIHSFNDFFFYKNQLYNISWGNIETSPQHQFKVEIPILRCKYRVNDSIMMFGTQEGLFEYQISSNKLVRSPLYKESHYIASIQKLGHNEFLISTRYKGIFHFRDRKLIQKYQLPFISLKKAVVANNHIFAAGNEGIYVKKLSGPDKISWTKIFDGEIENLFLVNQTLFISFNEQLITKQIDPFHQKKKTYVLLNQIQLGHQKIKHLPKKIPYDVSISFDFDILRFDANRLGLYYQLKGASEKNRYTDGTKINFDALPSGDYHLRLFPVINGEILFSSPRNYYFSINPPFWETTFFYILISIVVLLILLSIRLIWNLRRKKRIAERAELESKLSEYKLLAVKAQVNPHFLSNGLAAIQALILKEDNDLAAHYLAKFSYLMRKTLYYSEQQFISVSDELQLADSYLALELLRFQNKFEIHKSIQLNDHELKNTLIPSLLLQPILENAIWHGLKFQENNPVLTLLIEKNASGKLVIQIKDNGPGFQNHNKSETHLSKGNQLITERIDALNQQFRTPVASIYIQSSDEGTGVTFVFDQKLTNP